MVLPPVAFSFLVVASALCIGRAAAAEYTPGRSYFGDRKYIEYIPGDMPLVISAPHGGREKPDEIPTREQGVVQMDTNTQELARTIAEVTLARTGHRPHLIICRLHRQKLDANREVEEAAAGSPVAGKAWGEYHAFIEQALAAAIKQSGKAFFFDLHGQGHADKRIELGYLHSVTTLGFPEATLNQPDIAGSGSLRRIAEKSKLPYVALLRGPRSLGAVLEARGFPCTPSPERPVPNVPYFQGGYTVRRHVAPEAPVAGLQIECNLEGLRDTAENRRRFAEALVPALQEFLAEHFDLKLPTK
jgi:N-formylglutamate amidohydrolase